MFYKKEIIETFTLYEGTDIEHIHIFINGKISTSIVNLPKQKISSTFNIPEYDHLQLMLKQQIDKDESSSRLA